jgi:hypothetical protein
MFLVVCYAGRDTKLMQNSGKPQFKRTKIDHWLNNIILGVNYFIFIISFSVDFCFFISNVFDIGNMSRILGI